MQLTKNHCGERNPPALREAGVGLVEVLVTVLILAIGLLGIAGVQLMSKRANYEATQRTTATHLANDILDRMRANSAPIAVGGPSMLALYVANGGAVGVVPSPEPAVPAPGDANAIMLRDLWEWEQAINGVTETRVLGGVAEPTGGLISPIACLYTTVDPIATNQSGQYMVAIVWRGTAKLSDPVNPVAVVPAPDPYDCGRALASGIYNSDDPVPVVDAHRRVLVVTTYIAAYISP